MSNTLTLVDPLLKHDFCIILYILWLKSTQKVVLALKNWFQPANGMGSTRSLVEIHNSCLKSSFLLPACAIYVSKAKSLGWSSGGLKLTFTQPKVTKNQKALTIKKIYVRINPVIKGVLLNDVTQF